MSPTFSPSRSRSRVATKTPIYAAIDLGSNSFHLLVARVEDGHLVIIDRHKEMVRLGAGLQADGSLSTAAMNRALAGLERLAERIAPVPAACTRVVATNTLRVATNSESFLARAEAILRTPVDVVSGIEEARLTYLGVASDFALVARTRLVVDIGGGSTELVLGRAEPIWLESLAMGSGAYSRRFFGDGRITRRAYEQAVVVARAELQGPVGRLGKRRWHEAVGSSGTIRAIERVLDGQGLNRNHVVTLSGIEALVERLIAAGHTARLALAGLDEERRDVFVGGVAVLHAIFAELGITEMHVARYALREGIVHDLAGRARHADTRLATIERMMAQYRVDRAQVRRVRRLALRFLAQSGVQPDEGEQARRLLEWAVALHEIGLSVAHNGYQRHSAYLVGNSDMPGFSRQEQQQLARLVGGHRRKLRGEEFAGAPDQDRQLLVLLRLAWLLLRRRDERLLPDDVRLRFQDSRCRLALPAGWLAQHPLTREDLGQEQRQLAAIGIELVIGTHRGGHGS